MTVLEDDHRRGFEIDANDFRHGKGLMVAVFEDDHDGTVIIGGEGPGNDPQAYCDNSCNSYETAHKLLPSETAIALSDSTEGRPKLFLLGCLRNHS